ncbi:MAG TPA: fused MFS/spermidine synthase [Pyrinomonadaceae bacterium]|jgi:spermidine synthase
MAALTNVRPYSLRARAYSQTSLWLIAVCFVLSGATGLIYEVLWARMLGLVFGATTFAVSAVLAAFMGGLALGSAWAGRLSARVRRPLRVYGLMEMGIALYALAVPIMFRLIDHLYAALWQQLHPGFYAFNLWRFALSCAALLLPTALMGATLPILAAALMHSSRYTETAVARLYTCNLFGAIFGTLAAGFLLLPVLGVSATIWTAAAINLLIGLGAVFIDQRDKSHAATAVDDKNFEDDKRLDQRQPPGVKGALDEIEEVERLPHQTVEATRETDIAGAALWLSCAGISGFVTFSTQVAWTRVLTMVIGSSTYAFSMVVALFLLGLFGGAYVVGRRRTKGKLLRSLMLVELATALSLFCSIWIINYAPGMLFRLGLGYSINSWLGWLALQALVASMLIVVPAFLMGMVMPLVLVWSSSAGPRASVKMVGRSYAVNTLGAIAGAFLTGFILIPKASTRFTILFAAALCLIVAGLAYRPAGGDTALRRSLAAGLCFTLIIAMLLFAPRLNAFDLAAGAYDSLISLLARPQLSEGENTTRTFGPETNRLLMYSEGPTATVSVREDWGTRSLAINGRTNASDKGDMPTQIMLGQLPLLLAPRMENGLIVGLASGVSVGAMLQSPLKSLECVELEPETIPASAFFNHVNHRPLEDARLKLVIDDARAFLRITPTEYDMIVSEPSHPWVPGVANLFTKEFFELGRSRLREDGVFVQWLQIYQLSTESLRSALATYTSVFPHVLVFRIGGAAKGKDLILVGSRTPLKLERIRERISDPLISAELARIQLNRAEDISAWYVCDERRLGPAVAGAVINTDDNMHIETSAPREAFLPMMDANAAWINKLSEEVRESTR